MRFSQRGPDEMKWNPGNEDYKSRIALRSIQATQMDR